MTMGQFRRAGTLIVLGLLTAATVAAQEGSSTADLKKDIDALKATLSGIQKDLQDIKTLLQARPTQPPPPAESVVLDIGNRPTRGQATAKVTLIEFSDYQCPFCGRHTRDTHPQLEKEYIATGKVRQVFLDLPLEAIHKNAFKAAEVARCAGEQGKYWEMHDRLFTNQATLDQWNAHAEAVGLKQDQFDSCLTSGKFATEIRKDLVQAQAAGVTGTPGFFLALTDPASTKVKTLRRISGAQPFANFKAQIDALLADGDGVKKP